MGAVVRPWGPSSGRIGVTFLFESFLNFHIFQNLQLDANIDPR